MSLIYQYEEITKVHFEVTSRCNAACPMCSRNQDGGPTIPTLPLTELTLEDCKSIFPEDFIKRLDNWLFCGVYGDPCVAHDTKEICGWLVDLNPNIEIKISTNGSMRRPEWWADLARILGKNGYVEWGLDGLRDTNHIYRKNTNWDVIMKNVAAFRSANGRAVWQFIPFAHNEHQIQEASDLATKLGFESFVIKRSRQVYKVASPSTARVADVVDRKTKEVTHRVEPAKKVENQNRMMTQGKPLMDKFGEIGNYIQRTPISCIAQKRKQVYVSADGLVFPCCWLSSIHSSTDFIDHLTAWGGKHLIDPRGSSLKEVIEGVIFQKVAESWGGERIPKCSLTCGITRDMSIDTDYIPLG